MPAITPNFLFADCALEAAEFYVSIFPNSHVASVNYYGESAPMPAGTVLAVDFVLDGVSYTAINGGQDMLFSEAISFRVVCHGQAEVDHYWNALTAGGREGQCGWLTDRFGVSWQVSPVEMMNYLGNTDPQIAQRAMAAMLQMSKLDLDAFAAACHAE